MSDRNNVRKMRGAELVQIEQVLQELRKGITPAIEQAEAEARDADQARDPDLARSLRQLGGALEMIGAAAEFGSRELPYLRRRLKEVGRG